MSVDYTFRDAFELVRQARRADGKASVALKSPAMEGTLEAMTVTREEIDAKLAASEARAETRFAEMNGKFDLMLSKMDALSQSLTQSLATVQESQRGLTEEMGSLRQDTKDEWRHTRNTQWGAAALLLALIGLGASFWFGGIDLGTKVGELVDQKIEASLPAEPASAPAAAPASEEPAPPPQR